MSKQELTLVIKGDSSNANKALKDFDSNLKRMNQTTKKSRSEFGGLDSYMASFGTRLRGFATAATIGGIALAALGKASVKAASDLNETMQKTNVVFGEATDDVVKFGESAARSMGISKQKALEATATFGNLFVSMGIGQRTAADMSMAITQLGSDLASFNNTAVDDALMALRAGLVGEIEPLRRFGVNLTDATLRQEAMELGLVRNTKEVLPAAAKAQAAYRIILKQTVTAQGDFARTASGMANQQRIMNALWEDSKAKLGDNLLPTMLNATEGVNSLLVKYNLLSDTQRAMLQQDTLLVGSTAVLTRYFGIYGLAVGAAGTAAGKLGQILSGPLADGITEAVTGGNDLKTLYFLSSTATDRQTDASKRLASAIGQVTDADKERLDAMQAILDKQYEAEDADIADERSHYRLRDAKKALNEAIKEHGKKSREAKEAVLDYREAVLDAKRADDRVAQSKGPEARLERIRKAWSRAARAAGEYARNAGVRADGRIGQALPQAEGSILPATHGGIPVIAAEAGYDEAFIPINNSARSRRLLEETARRMGHNVSNSTYAPSVTVYASSAADIPAIKAAVKQVLTEDVRRAGRLQTA